MRVLVADDDRVSLRVLQSMLARLGHEVEPVPDGLSALRALERPDAPRLAFLDWMMPGLDGPEVCRALRDRGGPRVYTVLVSGRDSPEDRAEAHRAGADAYAVKPVDLARLREHLARAVAALEAAPAPGPGAEPAPEGPGRGVEPGPEGAGGGV